MSLATHPATEAPIGSRWLIGLPVMLLSLVVLAENSARLDILPADADDRLTDEIYNSASGWRTPKAYENEWRRETPQRAGRIQLGYDSAYEEMRARDTSYGLDAGSGPIDHPQNTQFRISF